jgi:radical SAM protein with 4Fe4S-binding SPASM domain
MWNIGWGLTNTCNLSCNFCYSQVVRELTNEITDINIIKKFIDANFHLVRSVNFGTGENTLCSIWPEIVKYIHEKFPTVVQGVTTNGYLSELCDKNSIVEKMLIDCLDEIDISLDFGNKEEYNNFRNNLYVYDWVIRTLELCKRHKKRTSIVFIGTNETLEIDNIKNLFNIAKEYNAIVRLNLYRPIFGLNEYSKKYIPDFEKIANALQYINDYYKILSLSDPLFSSIFTHGGKHYSDPSGVSSLRILPDGSITPSTYLITDKFRKLNIRTDKVFKELNNSGFQNLINREIPKECVDCQYASTCRGGTFDRRYLWYNDFTKKDPYCPFGKENVNISKLKITIDPNFKSIHDGYLPTLFFSN